MAVTRIKNNQITDKTITYAKIADGTLTGGLFASDLTLNSNVTIAGNLTLQGNVDSISATNTYINDPLVVFNNGFVGVPAYDVGILVNRNLTSTAPYGAVNAAWVWREELDAFTGLMTTEVGTTAGTINNSGYANLVVGNVTANSINLTTGTFTASGGITNTPISGSTGYFTTARATNFSTGNAVISGGYISALSNATITSGAITTLYAGSLNTANAVVSGGYINNLANLTATTGYITNFSSGNIVATGTTSGTWSTSNVALYEQLTNSTTNSTFYVPFYDKATGNAAAYTNTSLSFNPSTGALTATQIYGTVMGTTSTANVALYENLTNSTTNATFYPAFYDKATGNAAAYTNTTVNVNPSTGTVSATQFVGGGAGLTNIQATNVAGTVATANVSLYDSIAATTTNATFYPQVVDKTSGNVSAYSVSSFSINPSTGALSATSFNGVGNFTTAVATNFSSGNAVITGGSISGLSGLAATTLQATNFSSGNVVISGGYISALTNATITTTTTTTLNAGTATVATLNATAGNVTTLSAVNFSTANAVVTGGYINNLANLTATTAQATNFSSGNIYATGSTSGTWSTANVALYEQLTNTTTNATHYVNFYDKATGNAAALTNAALTFNPSTGTLAATTFSGAGAFTTLQATNFSSGNAVISGGYISGLANITATTGNFGSATAATLNATAGNIGTLAVTTGLSTANAVITGGSATGLTNFSATTAQATNFSSGNVVISGGYISSLSNITATTANFTNLASTTSVATNFSSGNAQITGGNVTGLTNFSATTAQATNFSTGNARITGGYADNFPIGANVAAPGKFTTVNASGVVTITNTTNPTSPSTGALVVNGGIGVVGNVWIGGNLIVANIISESTTTLVIQDPLVYQTANSTYPYNYDIGLYSNFVGGAANVYQHSGMARNYLNGTWGFFSNVITEPTSTISWIDSSLIWDKLKAGDIISANTTPSTSTATGALQVAGGAGIAGNVNAGNVTTSMTTGTVMGNVGNFNNIYGTFYGTVAGGAGSANVSLYQALTGTTVNASYYIAMYDKATGNAAAYTDAGITFNPSTEVLTVTTASATNGAVTTLGATNFSSGNMYATGSTAGTWSTANVALYSAITATTTNAAYYPQLSDKTSGNGAAYSLSTFSVNPSTGTLSATTFSGAGAFTTASATNFSSSNVAITGGYINNLANVTATSATISTVNATAGNITTLQSTNFSTANAVITGGSATGLTNFSATTAQATNFSSGNAVITGGSVTGLTNFSATTGQVTNFSSGNVVISGGYISALTNATVVTGTFTTLNATTETVGTLNATAGNVTTLSATNFSTGNAVITGGSITGLSSIGATTLQATNFSSGNVVISGGYISSLTNATIVTTNTTTLNASTATAATLNATTGNVTTLSATNFSTGNAVISGGYISSLSNITATTANFTNLASTTSVATNFSSGNLNATGTTSGTWSTANVSLYDSIAPTTTNGTFYPQVVDKATGNVAGYSVSSFNINPSTGTLSATTFSGSGASLTNLPATAIVGTVATANVSLYDSIAATTTNATFYPQLVDKATGNVSAYSAAYVTVNPSTNTLSANVFSGAITATTITASGTIVGSGNIVAGATTESTSTTTGALVVVGGAGIAGNVYHGKSAVFNSSKTAGMDFVVKGKTDETLIWARPGASYDQVVVGNSATTSTLVTGAKLIVNTTDSMMIPAGTTAQRPSSTGGTDTAGMFRYNSTIGAIEWYTGSTWQTASSQFTTITDTQFNGDGFTVAFTSANFAAATTNSLIVSINGVLQIPTLAYSLSGSTITFTEAPASGDVIDVRVVTTTATITSLVSTNGYMGFSADNNGVYISTGTSSATVYNYFDTTGGFVSNVANVSVASANTATTIDTLNNSLYRSAKYTVQVTNGANYQIAEALVIQNGTTATATVYGVVQTGGNLGVLTATVSGGSTLLQFIATNATNNVRVKKEYIAI